MTRVLVLGLDGLAPSFVDPARLPFIHELAQDGASGVLRSTLPPYTPTAWSSIVTGVGPGRHGVFGFTRWTPAAREVLADAETCRAKTIWDVLTEWRRPSVVVNVPMTYPPRAIEGVLVSGMGTPAGAMDHVRPGEAAALIRRVAPGYVTDVKVAPGGSGRRERAAVAGIEGATEGRLRVAEELLRRFPWEFAMVVLEAPDRLQHLLWKPMVRGEASGREALAVYRRIDEGLRRLVAGVRGDGPVTVLIVSDHGFEDLEWELFLNNYLARRGLLTLRPGPMVRVSRLLPERIRGSLARLRRRGGDPLRSSHTGAFDPAGTAAFAGRAFEQGVHVRARVEEVEAALLDLPSPDGRPAVETMVRREEAFRGPYVGAAPSLFPRFRMPGVVISPGVAERRIWRSRGGTPQGTHHEDGVVVAHGPGVERREVRARAEDVAPTVYRLLGGPLPAGLDGTPIEGIGRGAPREVAVELDRSAAAAGYTAEESREVVEHLRGLGYLE